MIHRLINPSKNSSIFVFGARGTGKSTFISDQFLPSIDQSYLYYDLLDDAVEERLVRNPQVIETDLVESGSRPKWIIIDEVQKIPRLLDVVHRLIEKQKIKFVLSGSSARKLKKDGANLLGGRAFEYRLFSLSSFELASKFNLDEALKFGTLPSLLNFENDEDKVKYLRSYLSTYIVVEIQMEQIVRRLDPFRQFLEVAAQMNGKPLNYSKISREVGADTKTIIKYYQILEETYLGFILPGFHTSLRKSLLLTPKFYFFDLGVKRALEKSLSSIPIAKTSYYGELFESFVISEFYKLNQYLEADFSLSYFSTKEGAEVDLVLSRGKKECLFIEIKSSTKVEVSEVNKLASLVQKTNYQPYYLSQDPHPQSINGVKCLHWQEGLKSIFSIKT